MRQYLDLCKDVLENGVEKTDRTGTGTKSVFGRQLKFDLNKGFPLLTTKRVHLKSIIHELLWFLSGETNIRYLKDNGVRIWDEWVDENGDLGSVYGSQWRAWETKDGRTIDQITNLIEQIKNNPDSRRHLVSAWNVGEIENMALPCCHYSFQFYVADNKLSCMFNMRSTDVFLGLPFNIASYAALTMMIAQVCDLELGELIYTGGDVHIYSNHIKQVELQLTREQRSLPKLILNKSIDNIFDFKYDDFTLVDYDPHPVIKGIVSV